MNDLTITDHALRYASLGWQVIPVEGKKPIGSEWQKRATSDPAAVARMFAQAPNADGIGVQLGERSNLIDFDCDSQEAEDTFFRLFAGTSILKPVSFKSKRGRHFLFRWTHKLPQGAIKIVVDGLEIRLGNGDKGCQSVFPPSGDRYWINDPDDGILHDIPDSVIDKINARYTELSKPKEFKPRDPFTPVSYDTQDRLNVPKWLSKHGITVFGESSTASIHKWFIMCPRMDAHTTGNSLADCCITQDAGGKLGGCCFHSSCGMDSWQTLRDTIGSLTYDDFHEPLPEVPPFDPIAPEDEPATTEAEKPIETQSASVVSIAPKKSERLDPTLPDQPDAMGDVFYRIPGLIGTMIQYHRDYAPRPRPELSLVASICLVGSITGRKIMTKSGMRTNIYGLGLAPSGSGKEKPRNNNVMALTEAGLSQYLGSESPASDSALISEIADQPSLLLQIDEIHRYFATLRTDGNSSAHLKNIQKVILELTGAVENPAWSPKSWADRTKRKVISHPHLCLYGTSTADGFWGSVASSDAVDGFLARMMIVEASNQYPRLRDIEAPSIPQDVIDILKDWHNFHPGTGDFNENMPEAIKIGFEDAALDRIKSHSDGVEDRLNDDPEDRRAIWSRSSALAKRLSLIFAASRGPHGLFVTQADAEQAVRMANWCTRLLIRRVFTHVSANEYDRTKKKFLDIIRTAGQITGHMLTRKTQWLRDGRERTGIITELLEAELITAELGPSGKTGKSATFYRLAV